MSPYEDTKAFIHTPHKNNWKRKERWKEGLKEKGERKEIILGICALYPNEKMTIFWEENICSESKIFIYEHAK